MANYPSTLPEPLIKDHTATMPMNFIRSQLAYAQTQEFASKDTTKVSFSIIVNHTDKVTFETFYEDTLYDGVMPFNVVGGWLIANSLETTFKFVGGYEIRNLGALKHEIKATLEIV